MGWEGVSFPEKKRYEDVPVRINVISVTRGWVGVDFPEKALRNTSLEWTLGLCQI